MGRPKRADAAGHCYHMLNRANLRATIFQKEADYEAFEKIIDEAIERFEMDLFAYCLMPNHYHTCWFGRTRTGRWGDLVTTSA